MGLTSHEVRRKWTLWTEFVGGRELRPHAPCGAKSKKKKKKRKDFKPWAHFLGEETGKGKHDTDAQNLKG